MSPGRRIALVTAALDERVNRDVDLPLMVDALRGRGLAAEPARWDDPERDWSGFDLVIVRSTWDYTRRLDEFLAWADRVAAVAALRNPPAALRWSSDKRYLTALAERGIPVVPTAIVAPGEPIALPAAGRFVVKPAVGAGARDAASYEQGQRAVADAHVRALHGRGIAVVVQPYLERINEGERALVFLDGSFSHAVRKGPLLAEAGVLDNARVAHPDLVDHEPTRGELDLARRTLAAVPCSDRLLYARVDVALSETGAPVVMEVEVIEPNLFVSRSGAALERFAEAVERHAGDGASGVAGGWDTAPP